MKKIVLTVIGMQMLADGSAAVLTRPSSTNPSANGVHVLKPGQVARLSQRVLGFASPIALQQAVKVGISSGTATLTIDAEECKAGAAWENKATGQTGVYEKDWTRYSNHELDLGMTVAMELLRISATAAMSAAIVHQPVAAVATAKPSFGVTNATASTEAASTEAAASHTEEEPEV